MLDRSLRLDLEQFSLIRAERIVRALEPGRIVIICLARSTDWYLAPWNHMERIGLLLREA